jgi:ABC-type nitrate/sulfonate/bicarbonate transport system ATPase subunit
VDALLRRRLQRDLRRMCAGRTALFVTHSIQEAVTLGDRVVVLSPRPGRVLHDIVLPGLAPREPSAARAELERQIEELLDRTGVPA